MLRRHLLLCGVLVYWSPLDARRSGHEEHPHMSHRLKEVPALEVSGNGNCSSSSCHPGVCVPDAASPMGFFCRCPVGHEALHPFLCTAFQRRLLQPCTSNPCAHGGTCFRKGDETHCSCPIGFTGLLCQNQTSLCQTSAWVCQNGGTCVDANDEPTLAHIPHRHLGFESPLAIFIPIRCECPADFGGGLCESPRFNDSETTTTAAPISKGLLRCYTKSLGAVAPPGFITDTCEGKFCFSVFDPDFPTPLFQGCSSSQLLITEPIGCIDVANMSFCQCEEAYCNAKPAPRSSPGTRTELVPCCLDKNCTRTQEGEFCFAVATQLLPSTNLTLSDEESPWMEVYGGSFGALGLMDFSQFDTALAMIPSLFRQTVDMQAQKGGFCMSARVGTPVYAASLLFTGSVFACYCTKYVNPPRPGEPCNTDLEPMMAMAEVEFGQDKEVDCAVGINGTSVSRGHYCSLLVSLSSMQPLQYAAILITDKLVVNSATLGCVNVTLGEEAWAFCVCDEKLCNARYPRLEPPPPTPSPPESPSSVGVLTSPRPGQSGAVYSPRVASLVSEEIVGIILAAISLAVVVSASTGAVYWFKRYNKMRRLKIETLATTSEFSGLHKDSTNTDFDRTGVHPPLMPALSRRSKSSVSGTPLTDELGRAEEDWELEPADLTIHEDRVLGSGAFGTVLFGSLREAAVPMSPRVIAADWESEGARGRPVAVKMLHGHSEASADFINEIRLLRTLGAHPHLVNPLGAITRSRPLCLVVEFCSDGDLLRWLRSKRPPTRPTAGPVIKADSFTKRLIASMLKTSPGALNSAVAAVSDTPPPEDFALDPELTLAKLLGLAWQVADGMEYIASRGFIHRDLAARNIMLHRGRLAKVGDFGLCRYIYKSPAYMGSGGRLPLKWMALEAIRDSEFTSATDVWSFGVLLWELLSLGASPYPSLHPRELQAHLESGRRLPQPACHAADIHCPPDIYALMMWSWDERPEARPSFAQLKAQLSLQVEQRSSEHYVCLEPDSESES